MNDFKRLLAYAKPYSRFWPGYLVLSILSVIFGVVNYALIDPLLTVLFQPQTMDVQLVKPEFALDPAYFEQIFVIFKCEKAALVLVYLKYSEIFIFTILQYYIQNLHTRFLHSFSNLL